LELKGGKSGKVNIITINSSILWIRRTWGYPRVNASGDITVGENNMTRRP